MKWAYLKYLDPCLPGALALGERTQSSWSIIKPNTLRGRDGKHPIFSRKDGRAAEDEVLGSSVFLFWSFLDALNIFTQTFPVMNSLSCIEGQRSGQEQSSPERR